jgi:DNA-binding transcriptional MerR regulator
MGQDNPSKVFYRVGEVSQLVGVESYVLRYWEKMFPQLKPEKDETGQRVYTRPDIDLILRIKDLLYEERYTIDGARKRLKRESKSKDNRDSGDVQELLMVLKDVKGVLQEVSALLEK